MLSWPGQELTMRALQSLELFVIHDIELSPTARMAHYVIATKTGFEIPAISQSAKYPACSIRVMDGSILTAPISRPCSTRPRERTS